MNGVTLNFTLDTETAEKELIPFRNILLNALVDIDEEIAKYKK